MQNVSSFDAASLTGALLAASFLGGGGGGAWTSRRGLAGIEGVVSSFMMSSCS